MIESLPVHPVPAWLQQVADQPAYAGFPLKELLTDSLYYPACGLDGTPVKYLGGNVHSFVYADYHIRRREFLADLTGSGPGQGFSGYAPVLLREIRREQLMPAGWVPPLQPTDPRERRRLFENERNVEPFGHWSIWRRQPDKPENHGPELFSLLYLGGEMSATYQGLYIYRGIVPKVLAIIQPGSMGGEWESVARDGSFFRKVVKAHPRGLPPYLLTGSFIPGQHDRSCWSDYPGPPLQRMPGRNAELWRLAIERPTGDSG